MTSFFCMWPSSWTSKRQIFPIEWSDVLVEKQPLCVFKCLFEIYGVIIGSLPSKWRISTIILHPYFCYAIILFYLFCEPCLLVGTQPQLFKCGLIFNSSRALTLVSPFVLIYINLYGGCTLLSQERLIVLFLLDFAYGNICLPSLSRKDTVWKVCLLSFGTL